jgi:hypothetical protein
VDSNGNDHGFAGPFNGGKGPFKSFNVAIHGVAAKSTQALGCSQNFIVGSFVDTKGATHGFLADIKASQFFPFDAPGSSQTAAFGVAGTVINGVNDNADFVGFFSDGAKVHGFVLLEQPVGPQ